MGESEYADEYGVGVEPDQRQALWEPDEFRRDPEVRFDESQMPIRAALALTVVASDERGKFDSDPLSSWWTWFAGRPVVRRDEQPPWPRSSDGRPLAHVIQVDLEAEERNLRGPVFAHTQLPSTGIFQLFHDLTTYGHPEDAPLGAWQIRWTTKSADEKREFTLQEPPEDLDEEMRFEAVPLNTEVMATIPSFLDLPPGFEDVDRYERVNDWLEEYPHLMNVMRRDCDDNPLTPWQDDFEPSDSPSRMRGFGFVEQNEDYREELDAALPLNGDDSHELLLELNPAQMDAPVDWFHGLRPLQVWIRASDLAARNFTDVWCQIRTDA